MGYYINRFFFILINENVQTSLFTVKRIDLYFAKTGSNTRKKMDSGHPKTPTRDNQHIKFSAVSDRKKTLTNLAKDFKTCDEKTLQRRTSIK